MTFLKDITKEEQTDILGQYLPDGKVFLKKFDDTSNIRKVLLGLGAVWLQERQLINELFDEYNPETTTKFIEEWEETVGIPDDCFGNTGTDEERRTNILLKLSGINATTATQFEAVALILGFTVTIESGVDHNTLPLTLPFILLSDEEAPYVIIVTLDASLEPEGLPLTLPFILTDQFPLLLECLFNKLKPSNTKIIFRYA